MVIPILIINHVVPDSMMESKTRLIVVLILLAIQIASVMTHLVKIRRELKKFKQELEKEKREFDLRIKNLIK